MSLISAPLHALFFKRTSKGFFRSGDGGRKSFVAHSLRLEHQPKLFSLWSQKVHELEISWTCSESHRSLLTLQDIFTIYHSFGKSACFWRHHIVPCYVVKVLKQDPPQVDWGTSPAERFYSALYISTNGKQDSGVPWSLFILLGSITL